MTLNIVGLGLGDEKDITIRGLEIVKHSKYIYLEDYTSKLRCSIRDLEKLYGKTVKPVSREIVETDKNDILENAKNNEVSLLVIGDPMAATTHIELLIRAREEGIHVNIINNASIITAIGIVGLQLYKYGRITSVAFEEPGFKPETPYNVIKENRHAGMHTLVLLDLRPVENKFMTVSEAIKYLLELEKKKKEKAFTEETLCIGCARIGMFNYHIAAGKAKELLDEDFGEPPHCLIIPGQMHFMEENALKMWEQKV